MSRISNIAQTPPQFPGLPTVAAASAAANSSSAARDPAPTAPVPPTAAWPTAAGTPSRTPAASPPPRADLVVLMRNALIQLHATQHLTQALRVAVLWLLLRSRDVGLLRAALLLTAVITGYSCPFPLLLFVCWCTCGSCILASCSDVYAGSGGEAG
eukprot:CAMPEP_0119103828 /NCGR_PEP_ID=MMETSP1180-20130426/2196_1 /TAXON_ID=3052 ORGANISM="Chlamydomonas cf sp, Strain CCMP681" /NCGR_SAMPLE_ID=MMETSP1180 /ASSEMBLY_ACC=CAM_ASM_000741 /LENGTH=155 /DNA_ID=CAMNT_0007088429 /DNA_START=1077 /DNA_END=1543 /DNA_ORIENTATION=+